jgi:hypothetical protein
MHPTEFVLVFAWLVLLPLVVGLALLRFWHSRVPMLRARRFWVTAVLFILVTAGITFAFVAAGPTWLGRYIGVRDVVIFGFSTMWAPFAYVAAALALPVAGWLSHRGTSP